MMSAGELIIASRPAFNGVHPWLVGQATQLITATVLRDYAFGAFMGVRSELLQMALWQQSRFELHVVNATRRAAGAPPISPDENKKKVTDLQFSWHCLGLALDLVQDGDPNKAGIQWSWKDTMAYIVMGQEAKKLKIEWGGFWKAWKDYPHIQFTAGMSIHEAKIMLERDGKAAVWKEVERRYQALKAA